MAPQTLMPILLMPEEVETRAAQVIAALKWDGPVYRVSAVTGDGTRELMGDLMTRLETLAAAQPGSA